VWRGYRASSLALPDFYNKLGTVFIPATVEMQIAAGLNGYVPSIPSGLPNKPDSVPDETAILFWDSQQTYTDAFNTLAVRTYTLTHGAVYRQPSRAQFPVVFAGELASEQPYYLINQPADWMHGKVTHLLGGRPAGVTPDEFRAKLAPILSDIQRRGNAAGAVACAGDDYLVYWELVGSGESEGVAALDAQLDWSQVLVPAPAHLTSGLWDTWPGMRIAAGASLNLQFWRRWERPDCNTRSVAPDAVHVWRGYKAAALSDQDFGKYLGSVFIPAALLLQPGAGLRAYVPSMIPGGGATAMVPDQTALLFWADQQTYRDAYGTAAVRAYKGLHGHAFDEPPSKTGFPIPFVETVAAEQPYHIFRGSADWMLGSVRHFVGARPTGQSADDFLKAVSNWTVSYRNSPPQKVDAAIICAGTTYVAFWEHAVPGAPDDGLTLASLAGVATPRLSRTAETYIPPAGLWSQWPGIDLTMHGCINIQLDRSAASI
jgi:hypothetical protein